jgi:CRISPR-associated protein Cas1
MKRPYYLFSNGRLCRRQNTLCLERATDARTPGRDPDDDGMPSGEPTGEKVPFPIESAESIYCFGEVDVNAKLVTFLAQNEVPLFFFDYYGNYTAALYPREHLLSGRLKVAQVEHHLDAARRLTLARAFVAAALHNILRVLKYYASRVEGVDATTIDAAIQEIEARRAEVPQAPDVPTLMGLEGAARNRYYRTWPVLLGEAGDAFPFDRRERQPPSNELNALISFGNSLCYSACLRQLYHTALDPTVSYLHEPGDRRFSLALDLAEVFKPLLVDRAIFRLVKTRQLQPKHFEARLGGVYLKDTGRKTFVAHWDERLRQTITHRRLGRKVSYERLVRLDAYKLVRHLCDPDADPFEGLKMWW